MMATLGSERRAVPVGKADFHELELGSNVAAGQIPFMLKNGNVAVG